MNHAELRELLRRASDSEEPPEGFVASLWSELEPLLDDSSQTPERRPLTPWSTADGGNRPETDRWTGRESDRVRSGPLVALAAAAAVLLIGLLAVLLAPVDGPGQIASAPVATDPPQGAPPATADGVVAEQSQSPIGRTCDRLLVETRVAAVLRPGVVAEATTYRPSGSVATDVSAIELQSLVRAIDELSATHEIRSDIRVRHGLSSATGALDQAILLIEMGEPTLAHDSIVQAKATLSELASESALNGCLDTVS
jgi:hypothetical protein